MIDYRRTTSRTKTHRSRGFTIVELLIVIVVIAILAAVSIVSYMGIQQRANNAAIIDAASKSLRMIQAYISQSGSYPSTRAGVCVTAVSGCASTSAASADAIFDSNIATLASWSRSTVTLGADHYGVLYTYTVGRTMNGVVQPAIIYYWLQGVGQSCGLAATSSYISPMVPSTTGYTVANDSSTGKTMCVVSISGPSS